MKWKGEGNPCPLGSRVPSFLSRFERYSQRNRPSKDKGSSGSSSLIEMKLVCPFFSAEVLFKLLCHYIVLLAPTCGLCFNVYLNYNIIL
jgi:hypothetical protein